MQAEIMFHTNRALVLPDLKYVCTIILNNISTICTVLRVYSTTGASWLVRVVVVTET